MGRWRWVYYLHQAENQAKVVTETLNNFLRDVIDLIGIFNTTNYSNTVMEDNTR